MLKTIKLIFAFSLMAVIMAACAKKDNIPAEQQRSAEPVQAEKADNNVTEGNVMYVLLKTNKGDIVLELDSKNAPETTENFIRYVKEGHYDGTIFHRVIKDFMIQGGGMDSQMQERPTHAPIMNEADNGLKNNKYTIAMARTSDPDSATAQFFINTNDNDFLNFKSQTMQGWGYAVFGKVVSGAEAVDAIEVVATTRRFPHDDVPVEPVVIEKAEILEDYTPAK